MTYQLKSVELAIVETGRHPLCSFAHIGHCFDSQSAVGSQYPYVSPLVRARFHANGTAYRLPSLWCWGCWVHFRCIRKSLGQETFIPTGHYPYYCQ